MYGGVNVHELLKRFYTGDRRALARAISLVEDEMPERNEILSDVYFKTGKAYILGLTGSPGAGKSSLVDQLVKLIRKRGETVGVIAIDPTSPFTGGALLGDRIRMQEHALDKDVFIRSMGTRGSLGGLSRTTKDVVKVMDAFGKDWVIVETVGVGQAELDIMHIADTTIVVLTPGAGDSIQAIKAGIMEIADVFAVNKCDLPGAERVVAEVETMLDLKAEKEDWEPPVVPVSTVTQEGLNNLLDNVIGHGDHLKQNGAFEDSRKKRSRAEALNIVDYRWRALVREHLNGPGYISDLLSDVMEKKTDPYTAADKIIDWIITRRNIE
ncbi:MAG TPA: methylmalonyl Co-A mutase-associated GTPase MeaB [Clostridia bacterium]|nr:methylmalonyl Co-A mutase-associated GTPase MeaB [Clostridia bacterium]